MEKKERKIRTKRILSIILIGLFVIMCFSGCNKKEKNVNDNIQETDNTKQNSKDEKPEGKKEGENTQEVKNQVEGRYIEEEIELPEIPENCSINLIQGKEDKIELFLIPGENATVSYKHYINTQDGWEEQELEWLKNKEFEVKSSKYVERIIYGQDEYYYVVVTEYNPKQKYTLYKIIEQDNSLEKIEIPYLESTINNENTNGNEQEPFIQKIDVMQNGTIVINDMWQSKILLFPSSDRSKLIEVDLNNYKDGYMRSYAVSGNQIIGVNVDGTTLSFYNADTDSIDRTIPLDLNNTSDSIQVMQKKDNTTILANRDGIHRVEKDGTLLETTVEGQLNSMSMPNLMIQNLFVIEEEAEKEKYIISYHSSNNEISLMLYYFDKTISAVPEEEITVYSLIENNTIRQAIAVFQKNNKNVKVNYMVSMEDNNGNKSDYIRALNTELLEGNGADILVLDGLPVDSYIEKGVLLDINDTLKSLSEQKKIPEYMIQEYTKENQTFQIPIRFRVPIVYGEKKAIDAWNGLDNILKYVESDKEKPYIVGFSGNELARLFYPEFEEKLFTEQQGLDETELKEYLEKIKKLEEGIKEFGEFEEEHQEYVLGTPSQNGLTRNILFPLNQTYGDKSRIRGIEEIRNIDDSMLPIALAEHIEGEYKIINNSLLPCNKIGLNAQSKKPEIAKQFLEVLFSEDVQKANVSDGFPVNETALNSWLEEEIKGITIGVNVEGVDKSFRATWPEKKEREALLDKIKEATTFNQTNETIMEMVLTEIESYFEGISTIDQVTSAAKSKVDMYLAE